MINFQPIANVIGVLLVIVGGLMLTGIPVSLFFDSGDLYPLAFSGGFTILAGIVLWSVRFGRSTKVNKREGYLIVALGWLSMVCFSTLPFLFSGVIPDITNAFFETMSGMTTTGASVLLDIEAVPQGILYWRSLTQWIGGMGIIVLTVAIFPILGIGGIELFVAEAPGPTSDKLHPRIRETAKRLWLIYVFLTALLILILWIVGMNWFDAVNHGFTTMATGGFSTKNASIAHFDSPAIQYPIILFMFLAGTNYTVLYWGLKFRFRRVWQFDEYKAYLGLVLVFSLLATIGVSQVVDQPLEKSFRDCLFMIVSVITTTGFVSADYTSWSESFILFFFVLMFFGASAGSTSGGIKIIRHLVFFKNIFLEFKRLLHPRAVIPLKLNQKVVAPKIMTHIIIFLLLYLSTFILGSIIVTMTGLDFMTAIGAVATSLGNVGPGIGKVGPVDNFSHLPGITKWILSFLMLLGRLELFTIFVLFTPFFWRSN